MDEFKLYRNAIDNPLVQRSAVKSFEHWLNNGKEYTLLEPKATTPKSIFANSENPFKSKPAYTFFDELERRREEEKILKKYRNQQKEQTEWAVMSQYLDDQKARSNNKEAYYCQLMQKTEQRALVWNLYAEEKAQKRRMEFENMCSALSSLTCSKSSTKKQSNCYTDLNLQPELSQSVSASATDSENQSTECVTGSSLAVNIKDSLLENASSSSTTSETSSSYCSSSATAENAAQLCDQRHHQQFQLSFFYLISCCRQPWL